MSKKAWIAIGIIILLIIFGLKLYLIKEKVRTSPALGKSGIFKCPIKGDTTNPCEGKSLFFTACTTSDGKSGVCTYNIDAGSCYCKSSSTN